MSAGAPGTRREFLLFVYDAAMSGLPESSRLAGAQALGAAATEAQYDLVDLGNYVALVPGGTVSVRGEVYSVAPALLASLDLENTKRLLLRRGLVRLLDGREVHAYTLEADQARGRRRIRSGDYRAQLAPTAPARGDSAWSSWAKSRRR